MRALKSIAINIYRDFLKCVNDNFLLYLIVSQKDDTFF